MKENVFGHHKPRRAQDPCESPEHRACGHQSLPLTEGALEKRPGRTLVALAGDPGSASSAHVVAPNFL